MIDSLLGVIEVHGFLGLVVSSDFEGHDLQGDEARRHGQHLGSVSGLVQVLSCLRVGHASRVATHDVKVGASDHPGSAVPLNLCDGSEVEEWRDRVSDLSRLQKEGTCCPFWPLCLHTDVSEERPLTQEWPLRWQWFWWKNICLFLFLYIYFIFCN